MGFTGKLLCGTSLFFILTLLLSCLSIWIKMGFFSFLLFLAMFTPLLVCANIVFLVFWMLKRKRTYALACLGVLVASFFAHGNFYKIGKGSDKDEEGLRILTYNIRVFNRYNWIKDDNVEDKIIDFLQEENPDIIVFQEFDDPKTKLFKEQYPHHFVNYIFKDKPKRIVQAIFSKYPIIAKGALDFPNSANNSIYVDVLYKKDTVRVYNMHMESLRINPVVRTLANANSEKLAKRLSNVFSKQMHQANILNEHLSRTTSPKILCGDMNNTQFSMVYKVTKGDLNDTFKEAGKGFGKTYDLKGYPMRIDYIFANDSFEILDHKNYDVELSDHYPVMATLRLKAKK